MKTKTFQIGLILCALTIALSNHARADVSPTQQQKATLVRKWHDYFASLQSLDYRWRIKADFSGELGSPPQNRNKFLWKPNQWRIDTDFVVSGKPEPQNIKGQTHSFYDGLYRHLVVNNSGDSSFAVRSFFDNPFPENGYVVPIPLLYAFDFVWQKGDDHNIETLRDEKIWRRLEQRISSIKPGKWQGKSGSWLTVQTSRKGASPFQVFVDGSNGFPIYSASRRQGQDEDDFSVAASNFRVTRTMQWRSGAKTFVFPLDSETRYWTKTVEEGTTEREFAQVLNEASAPVLINAPLARGRFQFDIPAQARVYYNPNSAKIEDGTIFSYKPKGGTLAVQAQRAQQEREEKRRRIAALPPIYDEKADGKIQIAQALEQAKASDKRVLLQFGANWCGPCHKLHNLFHDNAILAGALERGYIVANIDVNEEHNQDLFLRYTDGKGSGIPFLVVLDKNGQVLAMPGAESFNAPDDEYDVSKLSKFLALWAPKYDN